MAGVRNRIETKLREALAPVHLEVRDDSEQHRGHGGWREGGETHFHVTLVTPAFQGLSRVQRHRLVNQLLAEELAGQVHALSLRLLTPSEGERLLPEIRRVVDSALTDPAGRVRVTAAHDLGADDTPPTDLLEALAHGLPVLASCNCGEVIEHDVNGFVLDRVTPDAIESVLREILDRPSCLQAWADRARIPSGFTMAVLAEHLTRLTGST